MKIATQGDSSEETIENIPVNISELRKDKEIKVGKQKEHPVEMQGEFKKLRPPTFDGESEEVVEAWLLNIKLYFQGYRYDDNLRACLEIFQMSGKVALWWQQAKSVNTIYYKELSWKIFKNLFKKKYMPERYYDEKDKNSTICDQEH